MARARHQPDVPSTSAAPPRPARRRTASWQLRAGLALLCIGALILAYIGWQLYATTWLAQREQARAVEATQRAWADPAGASADDRALASGVAALIHIPAFGRSYTVPARTGTDDETLERGFGILDNSASPGGRGNFALAGHRITHGEPLRHMPDLRPGDEVVVETADMTYTYVLDTPGDALTVGIDDAWVTDPRPTNPRPGGTNPVQGDAQGADHLLTLVTCAELFHTDTRLVAFGHLVEQQAR